MPRLRLPKLMATSSNDLSGASSDAPIFFPVPNNLVVINTAARGMRTAIKYHTLLSTYTPFPRPKPLYCAQYHVERSVPR